MTFAEQVGALRRTLYKVLARRVAARCGRPLPQLNALRLISGYEVQTQAQLAERLMIDAPAASRMVARLEADGLLKRLQGADRRSVRLKVTPAARESVAALKEE